MGAGAAAAFAVPAWGAEDALRLEAAPLAGGGFGYNGASPGPALRAPVGRSLRLRLVNALAEPTSLCGPGFGAFPGLGGRTVAPGGDETFAFTPADPGLTLYAPYGPAASAGLFGALVVDEAAPPPVDLDTVVVFSGDPAALRANATPAPLTLKAPPGGRVRLRLANAAPEMILPLKASGATVQIVAIDGQPSEKFAPRGGEFPLCPSARFELMFDLGDAPVEFLAGDKPALRVEPEGARAADKPAIAALPANPRLPQEIALERALRVTATLTGDPAKGYAINGGGGANWPGKPLFKAPRGAPVSLTLVNQTPAPQTLRLEGHVARQLHGLDDGWDPYWRDALLIGPGRTLHAAFVADAPGKWPLASASPAARARGLAAWYQIG